jgi:TfoX/Sxy family transcriptional regulator of competence genes
MTKARAGAHSDKVALYEKLVATTPAAERKGAAFPYTAVNGNMFSILNKDGVLYLRLSDKERDAFVAEYMTKPVVMYGALMKEYVAVPDALLANTTQLARYFAASYAYAKSLKPKPTTRPPKAKTTSSRR